MLRYDEPALVSALSRIGARFRAAFAAACAQRVFPAYQACSARTGKGDPIALARILASIWSDLVGGQIDGQGVRARLTECMALIPGEDEVPSVDEQACAEDAAAAIAYTLRTIESGEPQESAWAARRAYEAADRCASDMGKIDDEDEAVAHDLVQLELVRQLRDLTELQGARQDSLAPIIRLRDRAIAESAVAVGARS